MRRLRCPAASDTTSEPTVGNGCPGAPVKASMSGSAFAGQPGWNRGILMYMYPTPDYVRGRDYFFASAIKKEETKNGKRKSVHF